MRPSLAVALIATLAASMAPAQDSAAPMAQRTGVVELGPSAGGVSGIDIGADGAVVLLSDRGLIYRATITRDADEAPVAVEITAREALKGRGGRDLPLRLLDPEGISFDGSGGFFVSYELVHRVSHFASGPDASEPLTALRDFQRMLWNGGLEALATDDRGRVYVLPETMARDADAIPVWRHDGTGWAKSHLLPRRGGFRAVGADFGPDGLFYLLERRVGLTGFRSRVRRFDLSGPRAKAEETVLETGAFEHGNLEGLAVWTDASGAIRLTMVSDNNFRSVLPNQLVEYALPLASPAQTQ